LRGDLATVVVGDEGRLRVAAPGSKVTLLSTEDAFQAQALAVDGHLLPAAAEHGAMRERGVLCVDAAGRVLVARGRQDSASSLTAVLLGAGCSTVVDLDRGSHHPSFLHRPDSTEPPMPSYETSVLEVFAGTDAPASGPLSAVAFAPGDAASP